MGSEVGNRRVLVVEDRAIVLRAMLRDLTGYEVTPVATAGDALIELRLGEFDAIVADFDLGDGTTGVEILRAVRSSWPDMRRVLITGLTSQSKIEEAVADGTVQVLLSKPWTCEQLRQAVDAVAGRDE